MQKIIYVFVLLISVTSFAGNPKPGQIVVDPENPAWLKYHDGGPFFMAGPGDPEDFLYRGSRNSDGTRNGDQMEIINKLKNTGSNSIYMQAIRSNGGDGGADHNPYIDSDPGKGIDQDILDQWETWFTEMDNAGIVIYFFIYDDSSRIWSGDIVNAQERALLEALVDNFKHHKHLIWCVAEEYAEAYSATRVSNIANVISQRDNYDHVIAVHKNNGLNFDEFKNNANIDQFAIQWNSSSDMFSDMVKAWNNAQGKYNLNMSESQKSKVTGSALRKLSWETAMGGAYVMHLAMNIKSTSTSDLEDLGQLRYFMEASEINKMSPRPDLSIYNNQYIMSSTVNSFIAYSKSLSDGASIGIQNMPAGDYKLEWLDIVSKTKITQNVNAIEGQNSFDNPFGKSTEAAVFIKKQGASTADVLPPLAPSLLDVN